MKRGLFTIVTVVGLIVSSLGCSYATFQAKDGSYDLQGSSYHPEVALMAASNAQMTSALAEVAKKNAETCQLAVANHTALPVFCSANGSVATGYAYYGYNGYGTGSYVDSVMPGAAAPAPTAPTAPPPDAATKTEVGAVLQRADAANRKADDALYLACLQQERATGRPGNCDRLPHSK